MAEWEKEVAGVFSRYGVPEYVWRPIMQAESGGNPKARAVTDREESVGLFQINLKAHPEYRKYDLTDPAVNAQIAARDFIAPAWEKARVIPDPGQQTLTVWKEGIRPNWPSVQKSGADDRVYQQAVDLAKSGLGLYEPGSERPASWEDIGEQAGNVLEETGDILEEPLKDTLTYVMIGLSYVILTVVALFSAYQAFRPEIKAVQSATQEVAKTAGKVATTVATKGVKK